MVEVAQLSLKVAQVGDVVAGPSRRYHRGLLQKPIGLLPGEQVGDLVGTGNKEPLAPRVLPALFYEWYRLDAIHGPPGLDLYTVHVELLVAPDGRLDHLEAVFGSSFDARGRLMWRRATGNKDHARKPQNLCYLLADNHVPVVYGVEGSAEDPYPAQDTLTGIRTPPRRYGSRRQAPPRPSSAPPRRLFSPTRAESSRPPPCCPSRSSKRAARHYRPIPRRRPLRPPRRVAP